MNNCNNKKKLKIILITFNDENEQCLVSHGVDRYTLKNIVFPQVHPYDLGAVFNEKLNEWCIYE